MRFTSLLGRNNPWVLLIKPNLVLMVVFTSLIGYFLASKTFVFWDFGLLFLGVFSAAASSHIFNQILEIKSDALMERTKNRPLVIGKISLRTAFSAGVIFLLMSCLFLLLLSKISTLFMLATFFLYIGIYTPLKKLSSWNTWVGALPGSLPIFIGFYAAPSLPLTPDFFVWATFLILYIWQIPHFLSLSWKYKKEYTLANLRMMTTWDKQGTWTAWVMLLHGAALFAVVIGVYIFDKNLPAFLLSFGVTFIFFILMLGFLVGKKNKYAPKIFSFSLFYLPFILLCFIIL
jgi:protoheme IX farnesyltransferase